MKPLPRPVREVLDEPASPASVMRVWARVQVKRRAPTPVVRPWLVGVAVVAAIAMVVVTRARPAVGSVAEPVPVTRSIIAASETKKTETVAPPVVAEVQAPRVGPWLQGRHSLATFSRPLSAKADAVPADLVGALLESAEDAWRAGQPARVVAILGEVSEHHANDPRASEALFFLGLVQLDALKHPRLAKASFQRALELSPPEDLIAPLWEAYQRSMADEAPE
ncbi:MAG: hypothetical protein Q8L14_13015 [Myxococcales bacterium]|nr:hypothetical protein [Myxococcales bacterium]